MNIHIDTHTWEPKILVPLLLLLVSCGPGYHLRRRDYHERQAIAKGAVLTADTAWHPVNLTTPERRAKFDIDFSHLRDSVSLTVNRITLNIPKQEPGKKSKPIEVICPPDTVRIEVPVAVNPTLSAKPPRVTTWDWIIILIIGCAVFYLFGRFNNRRYV